MDSGKSGRRLLLLGGDAFAAGLPGIRAQLGLAPASRVTLFADPPPPMVGPLLASLRDAGTRDVVMILVADPTKILFPLIARFASAVCVLRDEPGSWPRIGVLFDFSAEGLAALAAAGPRLVWANGSPIA